LRKEDLTMDDTKRLGRINQEIELCEKIINNPTTQHIFKSKKLYKTFPQETIQSKLSSDLLVEREKGIVYRE
jgi:hypothetical protein